MKNLCKNLSLNMFTLLVSQTDALNKNVFYDKTPALNSE